MKKILITVLFSSFIFLTPSAITANKTEAKMLDENTLAVKLEEHLKYQAIKRMEEHNALSVTGILTDRAGNVLHTYTIYKDDN